MNNQAASKTPLRRTPLFALHQRLGARLVEFGGWEMPVHYTSIMDEHLAVRKAAGIFDISHMGEVLVSGPEAGNFLNRTLTNDIGKLAPGQGQYTLMCNEAGGIIDDLYAYRIEASEYLLIVNASRTATDVAWLASQLAGFPGRDGVTMKDASDDYAAVAIQGPRVVEFMDKLFAGESVGGVRAPKPTSLKKNELGIWPVSEDANKAAYVSRTGYTGEDGFEVALPATDAENFWLRLLSAGHASCIQSCGLGARDTLRTEVCYPLYGNDLNETTTPIEAGLGFFVALGKGPFVGRTRLGEQKEKGVTRKCVAFRMTDKSPPPRPHYSIWVPGQEGAAIGEVTSGTQSPSLGIGIGLGYVQAAHAKPGTVVEIEIRGRRAAAMIVAKPIYRKT